MVHLANQSIEFIVRGLDQLYGVHKGVKVSFGVEYICHFALEMKINNKSAWHSLEQPWLLMATANRS